MNTEGLDVRGKLLKLQFRMCITHSLPRAHLGRWADQVSLGSVLKAVLQGLRDFLDRY